MRLLSPATHYSQRASQVMKRIGFSKLTKIVLRGIERIEGLPNRSEEPPRGFMDEHDLKRRGVLDQSVTEMRESVEIRRLGVRLYHLIGQGVLADEDGVDEPRTHLADAA